jgi:hypothetical protein
MKLTLEQFIRFTAYATLVMGKEADFIEKDAGEESEWHCVWFDYEDLVCHISEYFGLYVSARLPPDKLHCILGYAVYHDIPIDTIIG